MERIALSKEMHPESLERLCATALAAGDAETAFMYADRRCRIHPLAKAHHFTLRAETLMRLGDKDAAIADIRTALALAPDDIQANRRMLAWGEGDRQITAAKVLTKVDDDAEMLSRALDVLQKSGVGAAGAARVTDAAVVGWAAWNGAGSVTLTLSVGGHDMDFEVVADDEHPLAGGAFERAAGFQVPRAELNLDLTVRARPRR